MPDVFVPARLEDAIAFMTEHARSALQIAGGTDVMIDTRIGSAGQERLVDLSALDSLAGTQLDGDELRLGALTKIRAIELDENLAGRAAALVEASRVLGCAQIRASAALTDIVSCKNRRSDDTKEI